MDKPVRLMKKYFFLKEKTLLLEETDVGYCIPCSQCNNKYIGQTSQLLRYRVNQHKSDCRVKSDACALAEMFRHETTQFYLSKYSKSRNRKDQ